MEVLRKGRSDTASPPRGSVHSRKMSPPSQSRLKPAPQRGAKNDRPPKRESLVRLPLFARSSGGNRHAGRRIHQSAGEGDFAISASACAQSGGLVCVGGGGV